MYAIKNVIGNEFFTLKDVNFVEYTCVITISRMGLIRNT